jgi:hypothetical protein
MEDINDSQNLHVRTYPSFDSQLFSKYVHTHVLIGLTSGFGASVMAMITTISLFVTTWQMCNIWSRKRGTSPHHQRDRLARRRRLYHHFLLIVIHKNN